MLGEAARGGWAAGRPRARVSPGGYALWDAMLAWQPSPRWSVQLNISSVLDKHYFAEVGLSQLKYGEPRKRKIGRQMRTQTQKRSKKTDAKTPSCALSTGTSCY